MVFEPPLNANVPFEGSDVPPVMAVAMTSAEGALLTAFAKFVQNDGTLLPVP